MRKIYRLAHPQNNYSIILVGKGGNKVRYDFKGNVVNNTPARLALSNQYAQELLESCNLFKSRQIILERSIPEKTDVIGGANTVKNEEKKQVITPVSEVNTPAKAIDYVINNFHEKVRSGAAAREVAMAHGVSFPNLKM